jgi:hypothetical protein
MEIRVTERAEKKTDLRHVRLAAIIVEHACAIRDRHTACAFLAGTAPRFAAATSRDAPLPGRIATGTTLLVADSTWVLAGLLGQESAEGRPAWGRAWDLDAPWDPGGNLCVSHFVRVGTGSAPPVYGVNVPGREEGRYLFDDLPDAEDFADAVTDRGEVAEVCEELLYDRAGAAELLANEAPTKKTALHFDA